MDKELFASTVYRISNTVNISQVSVRDVVNTYVDELKKSILNGRSVWILGLVSVSIKDGVFRDTLALTAKRVSNVTGISYQTCLEICNLYLKALRNNLKSGRDVSIRGICTLHVVTGVDGTKKIMTSISRALVSTCRSINPAMTVRVRTCKYLKEMIV